MKVSLIHQRAHHHKKLILLLSILFMAAVSTVFVSAGRGSVQAAPPDPNYVFGVPQPGQSYSVKIIHFKRYGPQRETIYANLESQLWPETAVIESQFQVGVNGQYSGGETRVSSTDGQLWFTFSSNKGDVYTVTNHRTGKQSPGPSIPPTSKNQNSSSSDSSSIFREYGWEQKSKDSFNGRQTAVFEYVRPFNNQLKRPALPVIDDLDVVAIRSEAHVDVTTGNILQNLEYAISADGHETLIESFQILMWQQEA